MPCHLRDIDVQMVDVQWLGRQFSMFVTDIQERSEELRHFRAESLADSYTTRQAR